MIVLCDSSATPCYPCYVTLFAQPAFSFVFLTHNLDEIVEEESAVDGGTAQSPRAISRSTGRDQKQTLDLLVDWCHIPCVRSSRSLDFHVADSGGVIEPALAS
jgi:hypothetical protein